MKFDEQTVQAVYEFFDEQALPLSDLSYGPKRGLEQLRLKRRDDPSAFLRRITDHLKAITQIKSRTYPVDNSSPVILMRGFVDILPAARDEEPSVYQGTKGWKASEVERTESERALVELLFNAYACFLNTRDLRAEVDYKESTDETRLKVGGRRETFPLFFEDPTSKLLRPRGHKEPSHVNQFVRDLVDTYKAANKRTNGFAKMEAHLSDLNPKDMKYSAEAYYLEATTRAFMRSRKNIWIFDVGQWKRVVEKRLSGTEIDDDVFAAALVPSREQLSEEVKKLRGRIIELEDELGTLR